MTLANMSVSEVLMTLGTEDTETSSSLSEFAAGEIARLNSILGASISDLELALDLIGPPTDDNVHMVAAVRDALIGCRHLAKFQRILARLKALETGTRQKAPAVKCVTEAIERARAGCEELGVVFVVNIETHDTAAMLDYQRMTQAITWVALALAKGIDRASEGVRNRLLDITLKLDGPDVVIEIAQNSRFFETLPYFFEVDVLAHWELEAARTVFNWERIAFEEFQSGDYGGFRLTAKNAALAPAA